MADLTKKIIFIILYWISDAKKVLSEAIFCEANTCGLDQECCGEYKCCLKPSEFDRFKVWVLLTLLILLLLLLYRFRRSLCRLLTYQAEDEIPLRV